MTYISTFMTAIYIISFTGVGQPEEYNIISGLIVIFVSGSVAAVAPKSANRLLWFTVNLLSITLYVWLTYQTIVGHTSPFDYLGS